MDAASLAKARKLSVPVGVLAGVFGSFVGVGGGVLIVPMLTGACKALPQRLLTALRILPFTIVSLHLPLYAHIPYLQHAKAYNPGLIER